MTGDLVKVTKGNLTVKVVDINSSRDYIGFINVESDERYLEAAYLKYIEPIPLTEEILKVNGFINHEDNGWKLYKLWEWSVEFYYYRDGSVLKISREIEGYKGVDDCHVCYQCHVHELQHALRLCGLNELADNFKIKEE